MTPTPSGPTATPVPAATATPVPAATATPVPVVTVTPEPTPGIGSVEEEVLSSADPQTITFQVCVTFASGDGLKEASWDFGDGTVEVNSALEATHRYGAGGTYTVSLRITSLQGASYSAGKNVTVSSSSGGSSSGGGCSLGFSGVAAFLLGLPLLLLRRR